MLRVIDHLRALGLSSRSAREALQSGKVRVRGIPVGDGGRLCDAADLRFVPNAARVLLGRDVVFLDVRPEWVVVYKPAGMLSVRAPGREGEPTVVGSVAQAFGVGLAVHRLDEGTSGCMLVARTERMQEALKALFETHEVERRYLALVHGIVPPTPRHISTTLVRDRGDGKRGSVASFAPDGKQADTDIVGLQRVKLPGGPCTLVSATLQTGRTHQVRIHLSESGTPVLGDVLYGSRAVADRFPRLALHATVLGFTDPSSGEPIRWDTGVPDDFDRALRGAALPDR